MITFDPAINLGTIIQLVTFIILAIGFLRKIEKRLDTMEIKLNILFGWFQQHIIKDDTEKFFSQ